jgi:arylsulfatase A-like enzyme
MRAFEENITTPSVIVVLLALGLVILHIDCSPITDEKPNIILIVTDDQGYGDLGYHGNKDINTPTIDKLAAESTEFTNFYASPACAPTRASLLTGRYNYRTGVIHTSRGGAKMHADELTLAEVLEEAGYRTGIFGKWHLGDNYPMRPMDQGFQESLIHKSGGLCQTPDLPNDYFNPRLWHNGKPVQPEGYCTDIFTDAAIRFIESNHDRPFFVYFPTNIPHTPLIVGKSNSKPYEQMGLDPKTAKIYGMLTNLDENLGRMLDTVERMDLSQKTIVIFMGDNGPEGVRYNAGLRGQKISVYEGGIRVPFFIRWPGRIDEGRKIEQIAAHIDLFPTVLSLCDVEAPTDLQIDGFDLSPLLNGLVDNWPNRHLVFQFHRGMIPRLYQNCAVRSPRYKLVSKHGIVQELSVNLPALKPDFELYDMEKDPGEKTNIARQNPQIVGPMREVYEKWYREMQETREFEPGWIHIGSEQENLVHLCRYQDSHYVDGIPRGWPVKIVKSGSYEVSVNRCGYIGKGRLFLKINDYTESHNLEKGTNSAVFDLPQSSGLLKVWFELEGQKRILFKKNHTIGDVQLRRL